MSNNKKIWSFFTRKTPTEFRSSVETVEGVNRLSFELEKKPLKSDNFFYDTWEKGGSIIYNKRPSSEVKSIVLDCKVRIY